MICFFLLPFETIQINNIIGIQQSTNHSQERTEIKSSMHLQREILYPMEDGNGERCFFCLKTETMN